MTVITNVYGCARCGEDHDSVAFEPLTRHTVLDGRFSHWAPCPTNLEPILYGSSVSEAPSA